MGSFGETQLVDGPISLDGTMPADRTCSLGLVQTQAVSESNIARKEAICANIFNCILQALLTKKDYNFVESSFSFFFGGGWC